VTDDDAGERLNEALARMLDYDDAKIAEFCEHLRAALAEPVRAIDEHESNCVLRALLQRLSTRQ
jgi:hypothetical protein